MRVVAQPTDLCLTFANTILHPMLVLFVNSNQSKCFSCLKARDAERDKKIAETPNM
jgi:hypothetical protein